MIQGYYFITDPELSKNGNISDVKNAVDAKVSAVQYRNKSDNIDSQLKEAQELRKICKNTTFIINDNVDIAFKINADGVHLGNEDRSYEDARKMFGKNKIIGITVRNVEQAKAAEEKGANYLGVGPIFETKTKKDASKPVGTSLIKEIKKVCAIPVVAIGGITLDNAKEVIEAGADAICAISAVVTKDSVKKEIEKFQKLFR
jgi:thiamine-phosphate pyrophosphorylase